MAVPGNFGTKQTGNIKNATAVAGTTQAVATTNIAATIPLVFNSRILPVDVHDRYDPFNNPANIIVNTVMVWSLAICDVRGLLTHLY